MLPSSGDAEFGRAGERNREPKTLSFVGPAFPSVPSLLLHSSSSWNPPLLSAMTVRAQYPSNVLLLNRNEQAGRESMEFSQAPTGFLDQSSLFLSNGGGSFELVDGNPRKRGREAALIPAATSLGQGNSINLLSLQPPPAAFLSPPTMINLAQLQSRPPDPLVSAGLRLAFEDQQQVQNFNLQANPLLFSSFFSPALSNDFSAQLNQHMHEFDGFVLAQGEQLRRKLAEKRHLHCRDLLCAAEQAAARRLMEKEAEVELAARRTTELEERLARLKADSLTWQAKARADEAAASALRAQLQQAQAAAAAAEERGKEQRDSSALDAESAHVDPDPAPPAACRLCREARASVVVLPCCHLCLCPDCDGGATPRCPVCRCATTGILHVNFS